MTAAERISYRRIASQLNCTIYVFRSRDEAGDPIWVYDTLPVMGRLCEVFGPRPIRRCDPVAAILDAYLKTPVTAQNDEEEE